MNSESIPVGEATELPSSFGWDALIEAQVLEALTPPALLSLNPPFNSWSL